MFAILRNDRVERFREREEEEGEELVDEISTCDSPTPCIKELLYPRVCMCEDAPAVDVSVEFSNASRSLACLTRESNFARPDCAT